MTRVYADPACPECGGSGVRRGDYVHGLDPLPCPRCCEAPMVLIGALARAELGGAKQAPDGERRLTADRTPPGPEDLRRAHDREDQAVIIIDGAHATTYHAGAQVNFADPPPEAAAQGIAAVLVVQHPDGTAHTYALGQQACAELRRQLSPVEVAPAQALHDLGGGGRML